MDVLETAACIAVAAHKEQVRKTDSTPYVVHPFMVAFTLKSHNFSSEVIAAALVHDVLEDTDVTEAILRGKLGDEVTDIVVAVTEDKDLAWHDRKKKYIGSVQNGSENVKAVSIADKIHNLESLLDGYAQQGPALWEKFSKGKKEKLWFEHELLKMFQETWDHPLVAEYEALVKKMEALN